jgi:hypothetical protein
LLNSGIRSIPYGNRDAGQFHRSYLD